MSFASIDCTQGPIPDIFAKKIKNLGDENFSFFIVYTVVKILLGIRKEDDIYCEILE